MYLSVYAGAPQRREKVPALGAMRFKRERRRLARYFQSTNYKLTPSPIALGLRCRRSRQDLLSYGPWTYRKEQHRLERAATRMITGEPRR